jgi:hypothetical protein
MEFRNVDIFVLDNIYIYIYIYIKQFHMEYLGKFVICLHTKSHLPSSNDSLFFVK